MTKYDNKLLIDALDASIEHAPHLFSLNTDRQVLYCGRQVPETVLSMLSSGAYHNMLLEIIAQADGLKRQILTPEELALSV